MTSHNSPFIPSVRDDPFSRMYGAIHEAKKRRDKPAKAFVCDGDLKDVWSNNEDLRGLFYPQEWSDNELRTLRTKFKKVLSILIMISWPHLKSDFRKMFFEHLDRGRTDTDLPFSMDFLSFFDSYSYLHMFWTEQYCFLPVVIQQYDESKVQEVASEYRLPISQKPKQIGLGGYGTVNSVEIPAGYLRLSNGTHWSEAQVVACKKFKSTQREEEFEKEVKNLEVLKKSLKKEDRIMLHLATVVHGNEFAIFLPLARLRDLEIFFTRGFDVGGESRNAPKLYDFDEEFPYLVKSPWQSVQQALLDELTAIAMALKWLHHELVVYGNEEDLDVYCAHMDFKPQNILIDKSTTHVGKWMISDFGLSTFKKHNDTDHPRYLAVRDVEAKLTSKTKVKRGAGPFQAPEVQYNEDKISGRKSDVWSLGCVLCEVLAFALNGHKSLDEFRSLRSSGRRDDFFYDRLPEGWTTLTLLPLQRRYIVRPAVETWLSNVSRDYPAYDYWTLDCISLIKEILVIEPSRRPYANDIVVKLHNVRRKLRSGLVNVGGSSRRQSEISSDEAENAQPNALSDDRHVLIQSSDSKDSQNQVHHQPSDSGWSRHQLRELDISRSAAPLRHEASSRRLGRDTQIPSRRSDSVSSMTQSPLSPSQHETLGPLAIDTRIPRHLSNPVSLIAQTPVPNVQHRAADTESAENQMPHALRLDSSESSRSKSTSADSAIQQPSLQLRLPNQKLIDMMISPLADLVAFLFKELVEIYSVEDGNKTNSFSLNAQTDWRVVSIASHYLAVYGVEKGTKSIIVKDLLNPARIINIPSSIDIVGISEVKASSTGVFAFKCDDRLSLIRVNSTTGTAQHCPSLQIKKGYIISQYVFSANGNWLCAWAFGQGPDRYYVWNVGNAPASLHDVVEYNSTHYGRPEVSLYPFRTWSSCVIRAQTKKVFVAQKSNTQNERRSKHEVRIPDFLTACICQDPFLICVSKVKRGLTTSDRHIIEYPISQGPHGDYCVDIKGRILDSSKKNLDAKTKIAVATGPDGLTIVLCTVTGEIEKFKRPLQTARELQKIDS